jgi:hypothetical protein
MQKLARDRRISLLTVPALSPRARQFVGGELALLPAFDIFHLCPEALLCRGDSRDPTDDGSPSRGTRHHLKKSRRSTRPVVSGSICRTSRPGPEAPRPGRRRA